MTNYSELNDYRKFTKPAELHKAVNTLKGLVAGITTDRNVNDDEFQELINWCVAHSHLIDRHPFSELIPLIKTVCEDGIVTKEEADDVIWLCNNFVSDSSYYNLVTSSLQFLSGLVHGIMADGVITDEEILKLKNWISTNDYLSGSYPFDEIESLLMSILADGKVTDDERNMLKAFLSNFIDLTVSYNLNEPEMAALREKYSIGGICAICQEIDFEDNVFCFTGQSSRAKRSDIAEIVQAHGGRFGNSVTGKTRYLIVGNEGNPCWAFSCYGRKIEEAVARRKNGQVLTIVNELDFWDILDDLE